MMKMKTLYGLLQTLITGSNLILHLTLLMSLSSSLMRQWELSSQIHLSRLNLLSSSVSLISRPKLKLKLSKVEESCLARQTNHHRKALKMKTKLISFQTSLPSHSLINLSNQVLVKLQFLNR